jgi:hypothetical protein
MWWTKPQNVVSLTTKRGAQNHKNVVKQTTFETEK